MKKVPFLLSIIQGAIGKKYVVKHYQYGIVVTKFPDMKGIIASRKQKVCRDAFKEAVAYARDIIQDAEKKKALQKRIGKRKKLYQAAIKEYMQRVKTSAIEKPVPNPRLYRNHLKVVYKVIKIIPEIQSCHRVSRLFSSKRINDNFYHHFASKANAP